MELLEEILVRGWVRLFVNPLSDIFPVSACVAMLYFCKINHASLWDKHVVVFHELNS